MNGIIDFSEFESHKLVEQAAHYKNLIAAVFNNLKYPHPVSGDYLLYSGEIISYDGPADYTHPILRRVILEATLLHAYDLLKESKVKDCETAVRQAFSAAVTEIIERQDVAFINKCKEKARSAAAFEFQPRSSNKRLEKFGVRLSYDCK